MVFPLIITNFYFYIKWQRVIKILFKTINQYKYKGLTKIVLHKNLMKKTEKGRKKTIYYKIRWSFFIYIIYR